MTEQRFRIQVENTLQSILLDYEKGLFTFEEFFQSLDKVLSDNFTDRFILRFFCMLMQEVMK